MVIVTELGRTVEDYLAHFEQLIFPRPAQCPQCQAADPFIGHGFYGRKPLDTAHAYHIRIKRWYCTACHGTLSLLPSFVLRFRHYLLVVIQSVVVARYEGGASWAQVARQGAPHGAPSARTIRRWCRSFATHAPVWWAAVQQTLARYDAAAPGLDPLGAAAGPREMPPALLHAALHLLAWAKTRWAELADYGLADRLRFLWHWGFGQGLARLI